MSNRQDGGWQLPIPFHQFDLPSFPLTALPPWHRGWVEAEAIQTQTPPDLAAMVSLTVVATVMAKKVEVCVKANWVEPVNIYTLTVLPPANRKSAVFRDATRPLVKYMRDDAQRLAPTIRAAVTQHNILVKRLKRAEDAAARASGAERDQLQEDAKVLADELANIVVPEPVRLIVDDATPERIVSLMAINDGRMSVMSAEGGVIGMMAGRYSKDPNYEVFLKGWSGDEIYVDRVGRPPEHILDPALTVGLTVQPSVMHGLMEKAGFRERGLPARFFYSLPPSPVGHRQTNPRPMPPDVHADYQRRIRELLEIPHDSDDDGNPRPYPLMFSSEARAVFDQFQGELEPRLGPSGDLESLADWGGKLAGGVARIAGLLHVIRYAGVKAPWEASIEVQTVDAAILIGRYLIPHAQAAFAEMGADKEVEQAKRILRWIVDKRRTAFSIRDAFEALKGRLGRVEDLAAPVALLMDHGYIRRAPLEEREGPGRPGSPEYEVNPECHSQYSHNPQNSPAPGNSANSANSANGIAGSIEAPNALEPPEDDLEEGVL